MNEQIVIDVMELDEAVFAACQDVSDKLTGLTTRQKLQFALDTAAHIMKSVSAMTGPEKERRSDAARKAANTRYAKNRQTTPTPGPALPPAPLTEASATVAAAPVEGLQQPPVPPQVPQPPMPPPPHPALAPQGLPAAPPPAPKPAQPFGAPPA
jgi:hypothetical protein